MNICFLLGEIFKNGGIGRVTTTLTNTLCEDDSLNINLLCYTGLKMPNFYELNPKIKQDFLLENHCTMKTAMLKGAHIKLHRYLIDNDIDIIVACGVLYFPISVLAAKNTKAKCICWEHCHLGNANDIKFENICRWYGAKNADRVVTLTKHDQKEYKSYYKISNVSQIYNPIDPVLLKKSAPYDPDTKKIISVGRLTYPKYYEMLIEVAEILLPKHPEYTWNLYGNGELYDKLDSLIKEAGLEGRVILKGQANNIYELYNDHSILVMTSRYEGFPMALVEGAAKNLPMVAFDVLTGPNEIITDGENGYLIPPFDKHQMAGKIEKLITNRDLRIKMSETCKKYRSEFEIAGVIARWRNLFDELTGGNT